MSDTAERLRFDDLAPYLLLKNGNFLYKVPFRGGWAVLKIYYGSRTSWQRFTKSFNNVVLMGQTSYWPRTRLRVERDCVKLWSQHGFRTFELFENVTVEAPGCPEGGYLLFGFVDAQTLEDVLFDFNIPLDDRFAMYRRFLAEWSQRHDLAESLKDARLVHENGDFGHVMIMKDGGNEFLWFDLEMVYRNNELVPEFLWHELIQYLWYVLRKAPEPVRERILDETILHYPNKARLAEAPRVFLDPPRLLMRIGRGIDALRKKQQKATSKFNVARGLKERVEQLRAEGKISL